MKIFPYIVLYITITFMDRKISFHDFTVIQTTCRTRSATRSIPYFYVSTSCVCFLVKVQLYIYWFYLNITIKLCFR